MERFFFTTTGRNKFQDGNAPDPITLLSGPPSSGKTSLLFQFAFNSSLQHNGATVVFVCHRRRLETRPPFLSQDVDPSSDIFQRIQIKYVEDDEGIRKYLAAFHMHDTLPVSVIIDDFAEFFEERNCQERYNNPRGRDLAMVRTLALCRNAILHAKGKGPCSLVLSDTHHGDSPRLLYIYKRWASSIYTIRGDASGSFILKNNFSDSASSKRTRSAKYSIELQHLVLEAITEGTEQKD